MHDHVGHRGRHGAALVRVASRTTLRDTPFPLLIASNVST